MEKKWTLPNLLSTLRLLLAGVFVWTFFCVDENGHTLSGFVALAAALTDALDGWVARTFRQTSSLGQVLDPLADKLLQGAICVCLGCEYRLVVLPLIYLGKEVCMLLGGFLMLRANRSIPPSRWFGKVSTACFFVCTLSILFFCHPDYDRTAVVGLLSAAVVTMLGAFAGYFKLYLMLNSHQPEEKPNG